MAKFVTLERKHFWYGIVAAAVLVGMVIISSALSGQIMESSSASTSDGASADLKIVSLDFEPKTMERDLVYGTTKIDKAKVLNASSFKMSAVVQNVTDKKMTNISVTLTISQQGNAENQQIKQGNIPALEPGASARVTFENLKALGDAAGKDAALGQHELLMHFSTNAEGGLSLPTETKVNFIVDTTQK